MLRLLKSCLFWFQLLLFLVNHIRAEDDPFAPKTDDDPLAAAHATDGDPFAPQDEDPFATQEDSEPNPWDKYPWDVTFTISRATALLSVVGSAWIILEVLTDKKKRGLAYHRIVLGLCIFDLLSSFWLFVGVWVNVNERGLGATAKFGSGWCEASGFFIYLGSICIPFYNAALAVYFWLTVRHGWTERRVSQEYEKYAHRVIFGIAIVPAIAAIPLNLYNPWYNYCFTTTASNLETGEERGTPLGALIFLCLFWSAVFASALILTSAMLSLYINVYKLQQRVRRYNFGGPSSNEQIQQEGSSQTTLEIGKNQEPTGGSSRRRSLKRALDSARDVVSRSVASSQFREGDQSSVHENHNRERTRRVRAMAMLYTVPFYATWVVPSVFFIMFHVAFNNPDRSLPTSRASFAVNTYIATVLPLQGFFNWFIYMLPRFQRLKREHPSWALRRIMCGVVGRMFQRACCDCSRRSHSTDHPTSDVVEGSTADDPAHQQRMNITSNAGGDDIDGDEDIDDDGESMMASIYYVGADGYEIDESFEDYEIGLKVDIGDDDGMAADDIEHVNTIQNIDSLGQQREGDEHFARSERTSSPTQSEISPPLSQSERTFGSSTRTIQA
jgi:hypothetical protein